MRMFSIQTVGDEKEDAEYRAKSELHTKLVIITRRERQGRAYSAGKPYAD